jgi:hypothetical protein
MGKQSFFVAIRHIRTETEESGARCKRGDDSGGSTFESYLFVSRKDT